MASSKSSPIILSSSKDWKPWIQLIKSIALEHDVWKYANPDATPHPFPTEPMVPSPLSIRGPIEVSQPSSARTLRSQTPSGSSSDASPTTFRDPVFSDLTPTEQAYLMSLFPVYNRLPSNHQKKIEALAKLRTRIQETLNPQFYFYAEADTPFEILVKLRDRFMPSDYSQAQEVRTTWISLQKENKVVDVEAWLQSWQTCYDDAIQHGLPEVQGEWPILTFLEAAKLLDSNWSTIKLINRSEGRKYEFHELLTSFRHYYRDSNAKRVFKKPASFVATTEASSSPPATPTLQGKDRNGKKKTCLCGEQHAWSKCPYLFEWNRPSGWKEDKDIMNQVTEKRKNPVVEKTLQSIRDKRIASTTSTTPDAPQTGSNMPRGAPAFKPSPLPTALSAHLTHYALANSFILDSGATDHVANNRDRFSSFTDAQEGEALVAGSDLAPIKGWGTVKITLQCEGKTREFELYGVAFIPTFNVNVVSYSKLHDKRIFWDPRNQRLEYNGITFATITRGHGQWLLEYNPVPNPAAYPALSSRTAKPKAIWTMQQAHDRLGRAPVGSDRSGFGSNP